MKNLFQLTYMCKLSMLQRVPLKEKSCFYWPSIVIGLDGEIYIVSHFLQSIHSLMFLSEGEWVFNTEGWRSRSTAPSHVLEEDVGMLLGLHFGLVNSSITQQLARINSAIALLYNLWAFFSEGVDLTAPKLIAHFAAYRRPQMYSSMFKFLPSFPVYSIERTIKCD
jgi:hypothetical protein